MGLAEAKPPLRLFNTPDAVLSTNGCALDPFAPAPPHATPTDVDALEVLAVAAACYNM